MELHMHEENEKKKRINEQIEKIFFLMVSSNIKIHVEKISALEQ